MRPLPSPSRVAVTERVGGARAASGDVPLREGTLRATIARGESSAYVQLGRLLETAERLAEAEQLYKDGIAAGEMWLYDQLGDLLSNVEGRAAEAEAADRTAIAAGFNEIHYSLGQLLSRLDGPEGDAERAFDGAIAEGDTEAYVALGQLLEQMGGRDAEAEQAYRSAIAAEHRSGWLFLGQLYENQQRSEDAATAFRAGMDGGDPFAASWLCSLLSHQPGREEEAEAALGAAIAAGQPTFTSSSGCCMSGGRDERSRHCGYTGPAIKAGLLEDGHIFLARYEATRGRPDLAEEILRREADLENTQACLVLADLLTNVGRHEEAEASLRRAIELGETAGHACLAKLLADNRARSDAPPGSVDVGP